MCFYLSGFDFDGPYPLDTWVPPHQAGVYALLQCTEAPDQSTTYTPLFFGRTDDLAVHDPHAHPRMPNWTKGIASHLQLLIGVHYMPGSNIFLRQLVEETLLAVYHPTGNYGWAWSPQDGLTHRCYT